jgi:hypothetical protein
LAFCSQAFKECACAEVNIDKNTSNMKIAKSMVKILYVFLRKYIIMAQNNYLSSTKIPSKHAK